METNTPLEYNDVNESTAYNKINADTNQPL